MVQTDNTGIFGPKSIRIGGMTLKQLPIAEAAHAKEQWARVLQNEVQNEIENILVGAPKQRVAYLQGRITECYQNIDRMLNTRDEYTKSISDYKGQIMMCQFRDKEILRIKADDPDKEQKIRELKLRFPPYNIMAMEQQIIQFEESVVRFTDVVAQEHASIAEFSEVMGKCQARDQALRPYGAKVA